MHNTISSNKNSTRILQNEHEEIMYLWLEVTGRSSLNSSKNVTSEPYFINILFVCTVILQYKVAYSSYTWHICACSMVAALVIMKSWSGFSQQKLCLVPQWCNICYLSKISGFATTVASSVRHGRPGKGKNYWRGRFCRTWIIDVLKPQWSRAVPFCFSECQGTTLTLYLNNTDVRIITVSINSVSQYLLLVYLKMISI
jgi:hypothetical protein